MQRTKVRTIPKSRGRVDQSTARRLKEATRPLHREPPIPDKKAEDALLGELLATDLKFRIARVSRQLKKKMLRPRRRQTLRQHAREDEKTMVAKEPAGGGPQPTGQSQRN